MLNNGSLHTSSPSALEVDGSTLSIPGTMLLLGTLGSTAYGLATPTSDRDRVGVFLADSFDVLGLSAAKAVDRSVTRTDPDVAVHELGKFVSLALRANPTVLELLFCDQFEMCSSVGERLVELTPAFLSEKAVRNAYVGYARAQLKAAEARTHRDGTGDRQGPSDRRVAKHARHTLRLAVMGEQLLSSGSLRLDVSHLREELFAAGELAVSDPVSFAALAAESLYRLENAVSVLPERPDFVRVESFLVDARVEALRGALNATS